MTASSYLGIALAVAAMSTPLVALVGCGEMSREEHQDEKAFKAQCFNEAVDEASGTYERTKSRGAAGRTGVFAYETCLGEPPLAFQGDS